MKKTIAQKITKTYHGTKKLKIPRRWKYYQRMKNKIYTTIIKAQASLKRQTKHRKNHLKKKYEILRLALAKRTYEVSRKKKLSK